jgi:UDP-N-acetylmuramate dehydrogenase
MFEQTTTGPTAAEQPAAVRLGKDFDLSAFNTFGLRSRADYGTVVSHLDQVPHLVDQAAALGLRLIILGRGSNVLLRERIGNVVAVMAAKGRSVVEQSDCTLIKACAGEDWPTLVEWATSSGYWGLENLAGIPGTVGAAPVQNIGAYGVELADRIHSLEAYDVVEKRSMSFGLADCNFDYRQSRFKQEAGRYVILSVTLSLPNPWRPTLGYAGLDAFECAPTAPAIMERILALRHAKLPDWRLLGNAGSFFHNPVVAADTAECFPGSIRYLQPDGRFKISAAWLIEHCGFKGYRVGAAGVHAQHALVLVNYGGATRFQVSELKGRIREAVQDRFGIQLTQEPVDI